LERAIALALEQSQALSASRSESAGTQRLPPPLPATTSGADGGHQRADAGPLTAREVDVAIHIAAGLTNRQIANALIVSERTVDTHVSHILHKLDLANRAQVATWVAQRGLE
jgi:DNA-binding NarL/FixJ family response regulator